MSTEKQNSFQCLQILSDTDDDNDDNEMGGQEIDDAVVSNGDELKSAIRNGIKECVINESDDKLTLSVRRGFSFADFKSILYRYFTVHCIYIYVDIYIHIHIYIYLYIYFVVLKQVSLLSLFVEMYQFVIEIFSLEALQEVKDLYFTGDEQSGYEPSIGIVNIADGKAFSVGHLYAASMCNGGPGPSILAPWMYDFFVCGMPLVMQKLPSHLPDSKYSDLYEQVFSYFLFMLVIRNITLLCPKIPVCV